MVVPGWFYPDPQYAQHCPYQPARDVDPSLRNMEKELAEGF